jgi:hypothetical protein
VVASQALPAGSVVGRFVGPVVSYDQVPEDEIVYVISFQAHRWLIPQAPERFLNHSCEPNCRFEPSREIVTVRAVAAGEELTIPYDWAHRADVERHPDHYFWDPRWTFRCRCRAPSCRGLIDRYRPE